MADRSTFDLAGKRVWVAGHRGLVGAALTRRLKSEGCTLLETARADVDLREQSAVRDWMRRERPDAVFVAAATVGGIQANASRPAEFLYDNLMIEANIIHAAHEVDVGKLLFLGSSCIYPRLADQPITEAALLTGPLEPTNEWYAIAKIAGIKLAQAYRRQYGRHFISAMPTNLYGPNDNFDLASSHVLPALIRKMHEAKVSRAPSVVIWGTGTPRREFLHVDDLADALVHLMKTYDGDGHVNVGVGEDVSINELATICARVVGYDGPFEHDTSKPDGAPRKLLDVSLLTSLGWRASIPLETGIAATYRWFLEQRNVRG
jgi:GDP-L-fucose synthase